VKLAQQLELAPEILDLCRERGLSLWALEKDRHAVRQPRSSQHDVRRAPAQLTEDVVALYGQSVLPEPSAP
jgi:hypothetical protein